VVSVLTLVVGVAGFLAARRLTSAARRAEAGEHARRIGGRRRWHLPSSLRVWASRALADADVELEPEAACELWLGASAVATVLALGFTTGIALPVAVITLLSGPVGLRVARGRARRRFAAALPPALEQLAAALRGGAAPAEALSALAEGTGPLAADLRKVRARAALGLGLTESIAVWPEDRPVPAVRAVAGALALAMGLGGRAAAALDGLAASLREQLGAVAEARSLSAQARLSAVVVGAGPLAYLAFSALVDPSSVGVLVQTDAGRVCLVVGLVLDLVAIAWMRRIVRPDDATA
jgi:tight adherence protein B